MSNKKTSIWNKDFILVCLIGLATNIVMRMLDSNLASYAAVTWDSRSLGGQLTSFFNFGSILMAFFSGRIVDLKGRKNSLLVGCLLFAIPTIGMALIPMPGVALGVRLIQGIAKGVVTVAMASVVSDVTPRERMNEGMGMFNLGATISFAIGPMLGLTLVDVGGYTSMFLVCAVTYAFGTVFAIFLNYEKRLKAGEEKVQEKVIEEDTSKGVWKLIEKKALMASFINTVFFGGYAAILVFLTVYAQEVLLLSSTQISMYYTIAAVAMLIMRFTTAKIADKYGVLVMVIPGCLAMIIALCLLVFLAKGSYVAFLASGVCYGIGNAIVTPSLNAAAVVDSPSNAGAKANATFYFLMDFGILIASYVFGLLIDASATPEIGYNMSFLISCGVQVAAIVLSLLFLNENARKRRRES